MNIRCITNRSLAAQDYDIQIEQIARAKPEALILREKDMEEEAYERLAKKVMDICARYEVTCILHNFVNVALRLDAGKIHLPLNKLLELPRKDAARFSVIGASVHSVEEALQAKDAGATYLTASHIFATDCKKGLAPRGLSFLRETVRAVDIPVYALGGICADNAPACIQAGAAGVCVMSECMTHRDVKRVIEKYDY